MGTFVRTCQGRLIFIIPMHNAGHPCAYDLDWYDDGGDNADELDGGPGEQATREILFLVGIWVGFFLTLIFHPFVDILSPMTHSAKAQKRREWDKEWGALSTEGNIWWKGSRHAEWVDVMGVSWLGWIFPVGQGLSDGLTYTVNPRFDEEGRWRSRADWPEELR